MDPMYGFGPDRQGNPGAAGLAKVQISTAVLVRSAEGGPDHVPRGRKCYIFHSKVGVHLHYPPPRPAQFPFDQMMIRQCAARWSRASV
jgi:hypothetical protein